MGLLTEPRATAGFDFIVESSKLLRLLETLRAEVGDLQETDVGAAVRLAALDVDLIRSTNHPVFREALDLAQQVEGWSVASPEALVVLKFLSAINPWRSEQKRIHDVADLRAIYLTVGADALDRATVMRLAALVYPGAEDELSAHLERIDRGESLSL